MSRHVTQIRWSDVPHLDEKSKEEYLKTIPPYQLDARTKGIPILGAGAIFPFPDEAIVCEPFELPRYWPRAYGFDADWNRTAALWGAWSREDDIVYIWSEHFAGQAAPSVHADAIKGRSNSRGTADWMCGAMDPSTHGKINQTDGKNLAILYADLGLTLTNADNAVEAGLWACYQRFAAGRLKIFRTCTRTLAQLRIYRRDEKGKVVKEQDDLMDCLRYLILTGMLHATVEPVETADFNAEQAKVSDADRSTGY